VNFISSTQYHQVPIIYHSSKLDYIEQLKSHGGPKNALVITEDKSRYDLTYSKGVWVFAKQTNWGALVFFKLKASAGQVVHLETRKYFA